MPAKPRNLSPARRIAVSLTLALLAHAVILYALWFAFGTSAEALPAQAAGPVSYGEISQAIAESPNFAFGGGSPADTAIDEDFVSIAWRGPAPALPRSFSIASWNISPGVRWQTPEYVLAHPHLSRH